MTAFVFTEGSVTARCAARATSAHVLNIQATYSRSLTSGQGFPVSHAVACVVAACSSSAAASMVILFTLADVEKRRSAIVTRPQDAHRLEAPLECVQFWSHDDRWSERGRNPTTDPRNASAPPLCRFWPPPRLPHRAVRTDVRQQTHNKRSATRSGGPPARSSASVSMRLIHPDLSASGARLVQLCRG